MTGSSVQPVAGRFDWYAATILDRASRVVDTLASRLHGHVVPTTPRNGYSEAVNVLSGDRVLCTVLFGGSFAWPHAFASSDETDAFVDVVRECWPDDHAVTRMDCALDFDDGPGTFARLLEVCQNVADGPDGPEVADDLRRRKSKVRVRNVGDWYREVDGRTFYLGSPKSAVQVRLYEKGILLMQEAALRGVPRTDVSSDLIRLEVQVRPDGPAKRRAARADPLEAFGYADWSRELLRRVDNAEVERVHIRERRLSDHERAMRWMVKQYRDHLIHAAFLAGGWAELGVSLEARIRDGMHGEMPDDPDASDDDDGRSRDAYGSMFEGGFRPDDDPDKPF